MTRVAILGACGRMGVALARCAQGCDDLALAAAIEREDHPDLGRDLGTVAGLEPLGLAVTADAAALDAAQVAIDFTRHDVVPVNAERAAEAGRAMVIGTTGLDADEAARVRAAAERVPIVWAPNMSLGVNVLFELVRQAAAALGLAFDAEIVEVHHRRKIDAPSGTALELGRRVATGREQDFDAVVRHGREGRTGARPAGEIGMHAVRAGDVVGDHTVVFGSDHERLELTHRASSRDAFAMGALRAARWVAGRPAGLYDMKDVLGL